MTNTKQTNMMNGNSLSTLGSGMSLGPGGPSITPPMNAGQASDMQTVYNIVNQLSDLLKKSREKTARIIEMYEDLRIRAANAGVDLGNLPPNASESTTAGHVASLEKQVTDLEKQVAFMDDEKKEDWNLIHTYEDSVANMVRIARDYATNDKLKYISQRRHYNDILQKERDAHVRTRMERDELRLEFVRATSIIRQAYRLRCEEEEIPMSVVYQLQLEVRSYRKLLGLPAEEEEEETGWEVLKEFQQDFSKPPYQIEEMENAERQGQSGEGEEEGDEELPEDMLAEEEPPEFTYSVFNSRPSNNASSNPNFVPSGQIGTSAASGDMAPSSAGPPPRPSANQFTQ